MKAVIKLEVNNITKSPIEDTFFIAVAEKMFKELGYEFLDEKEIELSLALVFGKEIRKLNMEYRKCDNRTDILSFSEYQSKNELKEIAKKEKKIFLGELILCYDDIKEYTEKEGLDFQKELVKVFSHGILHLLGFTHGKEMFTLQEKISRKILI